MKKTAKLLESLRHVRSTISTRHSLHLQASLQHCPLFPPFTSSTYLSKHRHFKHNFITTHQMSYISSNPHNPTLELIINNEWSQDLESKLSNSHPTPLTHETVVYILKSLDKTPLKALHFFNWVTNGNGFKPSSIAYSLMIRILGNKESLNEFWGFIKKMSDKGWDIDSKAYRAIETTFKGLDMMSEANALSEVYTKMNLSKNTVKGVVDMVLGLEDLGELELEVSLSDDVVLKVVWELYGQPLKAVLFFRWLNEHKGYKHNAVTYNGLLRVLAQEESIKEFWRVVEEMKSEGYGIDIDTYIKITRQFERSKMLKDAVELYELMMDGAYKPPIENCTWLLKDLSMADTLDISLVERVIEKYEARGYSLSKDHYDWIYRSLTSVGKFDAAQTIWDAMKYAGFAPDNLTYRHAVYGFCKSGRREEAGKMLDEMETKGYVSDMKTWAYLIQGHCTAAEIDKAVYCFMKMLERNLKVDPGLLELLVNVLYSKRDVDKAYTLVTESVDKSDLRPFLSTYKNLSKKLLEEKKFEEALNLLSLMKKHHPQPFRAPYIDYVSKFGTVDDALKLLKALGVKQDPPSPVYLYLLQAFFRERRQNEAQDLLQKYPDHVRNNADIMNFLPSLKFDYATV